jgi:hypothetical protein
MRVKKWHMRVSISPPNFYILSLRDKSQNTSPKYKTIFKSGFLKFKTKLLANAVRCT